jgi:negative regulator of sigma E activity
LPPFWFGLLLQLGFATWLGWLPTSGRLGVATEPPEPITGMLLLDSLLRGDLALFQESAGYIILPALVLSLPCLASILRVNRSEMVESFAFTQLLLGNAVTKDMLKSTYASKSQDWRVDRSMLDGGDMTGDSGWTLKNQPAGFRKVMEMRRAIAGRAPVSHLVYSDGLAAISVFIEPMPKAPPAAGPLAYQGSVNIYVRPQAEQMLTVVGETPARTVRQVAESLTPREK